MVCETRLHIEDFITPLFIVPGNDIKKEITSLPGQFQFSIDKCTEHAKHLEQLGLKSLLLFGVPEKKDDTGSAACLDDGIVQRAIAAIKKSAPSLTIITDLCFCEYTSHGHCGIYKNGQLDNDASLEILAKQAISHARAGADVIAPSGMLDGMIRTLRQTLDQAQFQYLPILSYAAKYASAYYGPFREAVDSAPQEGDRKGYQMNPANSTEALREVQQDIEEGADIVMIKPALAYLDIIRAVRQRFLIPIAAYNVSGEYAMIKTTALKGLIDGERVMIETLLSIKRAGANVIISYFAEEAAKLYNKNKLSL